MYLCWSPNHMTENRGLIRNLGDLDSRSSSPTIWVGDIGHTHILSMTLVRADPEAKIQD